MRKTRLFILFLLSLVLPFLTARIVLAQGITVDPTGPIFLPSEIWYPGKNLTREITVTNNADVIHLIGINSVNESESKSLSQVIYLTISDESFTCRYGCGLDIKNLAQFWQESNLDGIYLGDLNAGSSVDYYFSATMDPLAGNQYQEAVATFDLVFGLAPTLPTPTPTPVVDGTVAGASTNGDDGVGGEAPCSAPEPGAPFSLTAAPAGVGQILLSWLPPTTGTVTHYAIVYGTSSGNYLYGNTNVGSGTTYVVSGLSSGVRYYFVVVAVNDCAAGLYSNEASAVAGGVLGVFTPEEPAEEFEVLGEETEPGQIAGGESIEVGGVEGAVAEKVCFWWLVFSLIVLVFNTWYLYEYRERMKSEKWRWFVLAITGVLAFFADRFMHQWWMPSRFCHYMWLLASLAFAVPGGIWLFYWRKEE